MIPSFEERKSVTIPTVLGDHTVEVKLYDDHEGRYWSHIQEIVPSFADSEPQGEVLGYFLAQYQIALHFIEQGYTFSHQVEDGYIAWTKPVEREA
jgi:hypothetical protein